MIFKIEAINLKMKKKFQIRLFFTELYLFEVMRKFDMKLLLRPDPGMDEAYGRT